MKRNEIQNDEELVNLLIAAEKYIGHKVRSRGDVRSVLHNCTQCAGNIAETAPDWDVDDLMKEIDLKRSVNS